MAPKHLLAAAVLVATILHAATATTVYDVLQQNNLPRGLVPQGVQSYTYQQSDGHLEAKLAGQCDFFVSIAGKQFKFRFFPTFGAVIKPSSLTEVYGVSFQAEFAWIGISQVKLDGDQLTFQTPEFTQSFPVGGFAVSPICNS
uniref:Xylanase inhibitor C-terminal domain-containing protein n=1 Tax=Leersia perrieri TaxID=77586 RepID=A0A0D9VUU7_9ORYZ